MPVRYHRGHKLAAVGMREPCLVLVEDLEQATLLLAQSAREDSWSTRLLLGDVTCVRAGNNTENCRTMAQVAIYESDGRWVAEDAVSHEIILEPAEQPYEIVFISNEDYGRLQSCIAKGTMGLVIEYARRLLKGLPLRNGDTAETRYAAGPLGDASPEKLFDRKWACTLLDRVLERLRAEQKDKAALFDRLKPTLMGQEVKQSYAELAVEFHTTKTTLRMTVSRLRRRFRKLLREEIVQTVANPVEIDDEIRHLFAALGGG